MEPTMGSTHAVEEHPESDRSHTASSIPCASCGMFWRSRIYAASWLFIRRLTPLSQIAVAADVDLVGTPKRAIEIFP